MGRKVVQYFLANSFRECYSYLQHQYDRYDIEYIRLIYEYTTYDFYSIVIYTFTFIP